MLLNVLIFLINFLIKSVGGFISVLINILPNSPFLLVENFQFDYLDSLNWVLPLSFCVNVLMYWTGSIAIYYLVSIPMRLTKVVS